MLSRLSWPGVMLAALLIASPAVAALEGRLLTTDGQPAAGYVVTVVGQPLSAPCDPDGNFVLDPAPEPPFELVASGPNGDVSAPIAVEAVPAGAVELTIPDVVRDSVTVVSGLAPSLETLPASAATVLTVEELEQRAPARIYQALESVAGASKVGDGVDSVPALRNLARGRTLILIDGARVTTERRAGPSASFVDPSTLASVEVLRGPGSVVYGSDAFGGVINALTRDPEPGGFQLRFGLEAGLGAIDQRGGDLGASGEAAGGSFLVNVYARDAKNAEMGGGEEIFNSGFEGQGAAVRHVRDAGPGRLRLGLALDRNEDLGKAAIDSRLTRAVYPTEDSDRFTASWLGVPGGGWDSLETSLFAGSYRLVLDRERVPTSSVTRRVDRSDVDADDASLRAVAGRELGGGRLQVGLDGNARFNLEAIFTRTTFAADGTRTGVAVSNSIEDARQVATGLFATWNRDLTPRLAFGLGLRGDHVSTKNVGGFFGDQSQSHEAVSGNLALTASPSQNWTATLQVARGFRVPTLSDRYFRGPSGRGFVVGNPDLDPETSLQLDGSLRYGHGRTAVGVYAYRYQIDDLIERFADGDNFFLRNRGRATIDGLELEAQVAFTDTWSGELGMAWAEGETDGGANIDDVTAPNGWVTGRYAFGTGYVFGRVTTFVEQDEPGPTELERVGFTIFDLGGGWHVNRHLELRLTARNLGDKRYFGAADETADRAVGRSYTVGLSGKI